MSLLLAPALSPQSSQSTLEGSVTLELQDSMNACLDKMLQGPRSKSLPAAQGPDPFQSEYKTRFLLRVNYGRRRRGTLACFTVSTFPKEITDGHLEASVLKKNGRVYFL